MSFNNSTKHTLVKKPYEINFEENSITEESNNAKVF